MSTSSILIVEDEAIVAADLASKLQQLGYTVAGSTDRGEEAVGLACQHRPSLVLMDIRLAGAMDGIAAAQAIQREVDLPVVFLSAHSDRVTLERAKLAEPFGYILKPFEERELRTTIEMALYKHQADRKVREQREWFRVTLASIGDAVVTCDTESRITFLNPVAESVTGWKTTEVLGQPIQGVFRLINEQTHEPCDNLVARVLREGRPVALANHTALVNKDGREIPIEDSAAPILDAAGRVIGAVLVFHDVTENRRAEEALQASEEWNRQLARLLPVAVYTCDAEGRITFANEHHRQLSGRDPVADEDRWSVSHQLFRPDGTALPRGECPMAEAVRRGCSVRGEEIVIVRPDGSRRSTMAHIDPLRNEAGAVVGAINVLVDITEHKQVVEQMRVQAAALEAAANAVAIVGPEGSIQWVNPAFTRLTGYSADEAIGQNPRLLKSGQHPPGFYVTMWKTVLAGQVWRGELVNKRKDGSLYTEDMTITPVKNAAGTITHFIAIKQDITERKQAEAAVEAAHRRTLSILESIGDGFFNLDREHRVTYINERGARLIGKSREELLGRSLWESFPEAVGSGFNQAYQKTLTERVPTCVEEYYPPLHAWFEARAYPSQEGLSVFYQDVTERKRIEETLRFLVQAGTVPEEDFFQALARHLAESLGVDYVCIDRLQESLLTAQTVAVFHDGQFKDNVSYTLKDTPCGDVVGETICCFPREVCRLFPKDVVLQELGAESYVGTTLWSSQGQPIGLIAVIGRQPLADPSLAKSILQLVSVRAAGELERRQAEEALLESHARLSQALTVGRQFAFEWNCATDEIIRSEDCGPILGFEGEAAVRGTGQDYLQRLHPDDRAPFMALLQGLTLAADSYRTRYRLIRTDGATVVLEEAGRAAFDGEGRMTRWYGVTADVTERERLLQALTRARDELEIRVAERTVELRLAVEKLRAEVKVRRQAEEALGESEERYRKLFESAPLGIAITDQHGTVHAYNRSLARMLGVSAQETVTTKASQFYASPPERRKLLAAVRRAGKVEDCETRLKRKDGSTFWASLHMDPVQVGNRKLVLTMVQDLTKRKQTEKHVEGIRALLELFATKSSRADYLESVVALLRRWCDCHGAGIRLRESDGRLPYAAHAGFSREFVKQENALLFDAPDCACFRVAGGRPKPGDAPCSNPRGAFFCNHLSEMARRSRVPRAALARLPCVQARIESVVHVPIRFHGHVTGALHVADRRPGRFPPEVVELLESMASLVGEALHRFHVEENLRESERRFRSMFESHAAVMLLIDPESGLIVDANPTAAQYYGYTPLELCSMRIEDLHMVAEELKDSLGMTGRLEARVFRHRLASGAERAVEVHASPVQVGGRRLLFAIVRDITDRKQLEKRILEIGDEERQRIGLDLHDSLGGHLTGLALLGQGLANTLTRQGRRESLIARELVQGVNEAVAQTRSIARGLCPVGLGKLGLASSLEEYAGTVSKLLRVECRLETRGKVRVRDESVVSHLYRIVQEAVNNAVRHGKARRIRIHLTQRRGELCLRVRDNGRGLPHDVEKARGMGLRTMRYRADVIGARMEISSPAGKGTLISCRLPLQAHK
jgi:PAS domain S-box-containing protein